MILHKYIRPFFSMFNIINRMMPKNESRVVFYSNLGFRDNVKAVYDYMAENSLNETYQIICSCNDYKEFKDNITNVHFVSPIKGIFYFLTSKFFFYSFGKYPILPTSDQVVINLWHGTPLKKVGAYNKNEQQKKQDYFSYVLAASPYLAPVMAKCFGVNEEKVIICGCGRNDSLFKNALSEKEKFKTNLYKKVVLWLPTFRKQSGEASDSYETQSETTLSIFGTWNGLGELNDYLMSINMLCIIKLHPLQEWDAKCNCDYSNIVFYTHQEFTRQKLDLYKVLSFADALITDYSSVYFDYLLLNRPIAFTVDDFSKYSDTRGFIFENPLDYMPGPKVNTKADFFAFLNDCIYEKDTYQEERKRVNEIFNYYKDGNNCRRILEMTGIIK